MSDPGLTEATQRMVTEMARHSEERPDCTCGWLYVGGGETFDWHLLTAVARAAREDVADRIQQARADALDDVATRWQFGGWSEVSLPKTATDPIGLGTAQKVTEWLRDLAAAIRDGEA